MDAGSSRPPGIVDRLLTRRFPQSSCVVDPRCNTTSIVTPSILSLVKELVPGTNYRTKITLNQKDLLNEVSIFNLYQNKLLYKTKYGGRHYELTCPCLMLTVMTGGSLVGGVCIAAVLQVIKVFPFYPRLF